MSDLADEFAADDKSLQDRLDSLEGLLRVHKFGHAEALRASQDGGEAPKVGDLEKIMKLERQVENMRAYIRVRQQTRSSE